MEASVALASFSASLRLLDESAPIPDRFDAKNQLQGFVRVMLDSIGLMHGAAVDCDVVQLEGPDGSVVTLDSSFSDLVIKENQSVLRRIAILGHFVPGLRRGLADFRLAIALPGDTLFLCYRALDGIRADISRVESSTTPRRGQERVRSRGSATTKSWLSNRVPACVGTEAGPMCRMTIV